MKTLFKTLFETLRALKTSLMNAFRPPITVEFPAVVRPRSERYRTSFALPDDDNGEIACIACLACEKVCPSQVIKVTATGKRESPVTGKKRQYPDAFTLDLSACIQCELCVQVCNSDSIRMVREPAPPVFQREDLVLDLDHLRSNARENTLSWGRGTTLQEMQEPKPKAEKKPAKPKPAVEAKPAEESKPEVESKPIEAPPIEAPPIEAPTVTAKPEESKPIEPPPVEGGA